MKMTRLSSNTDLGKGKNPNLTVSVLMIPSCTNRRHHFYVCLLETVCDSHFHTSEPCRAGWGKGCILQVCHFKTRVLFQSPQPPARSSFVMFVYSTAFQGVFIKNNYLSSGCKESHFYSLPLGQAEANIYWPKHHFN